MFNQRVITFIFLGICIPTIIKAAPNKNKEQPNCNLFKMIFNSKEKGELLMEFQDENQNGTMVNYYIKYVPESMDNEALEFMERFYLTDITLPSYDTINALNRVLWLIGLEDGKSVACFLKGSHEMVGLSIMSKKSSRFLNKSEKLTCEVDIFEHYRVKEYLSGKGLAVSSDYKDRGIEKKLLESAELVCRDHKLTLTSHIFASEYSNKAAEECGFELNSNECPGGKTLKSKKYNFAKKV